MKTNDERRFKTIQYNSIQFKMYKLTVGANTVLILDMTSGVKEAEISVKVLHKEENPSVPHAKSTIDVQSSFSALTLADDANNATTAA
jgi:hypothetical protein